MADETSGEAPKAEKQGGRQSSRSRTTTAAAAERKAAPPTASTGVERADKVKSATTGVSRL